MGSAASVSSAGGSGVGSSGDARTYGDAPHPIEPSRSVGPSTPRELGSWAAEKRPSWAVASIDGEEEADLMTRIGDFEHIAIGDCLKLAKRGLTSMRWVRTNKAMADEPKIRCRSDARECLVVKTRGCFYTLMPPSEAKRILFPKAARKYSRWQRGEAKDI